MRTNFVGVDIVTPPTGKCLFRNSTLAHCDAVWVGGVHYIRYV